MNCSDAAERITALVDGELPPGERAALEGHLEGCSSCREARAAEEAVAARLRSVPRPAAPHRFTETVMARVAAAPPPAPAESAPAGRLIPLWAYIVAGASAAAALLAMTVVGPGERAAGPTVAYESAKGPESLSVDGEAAIPAQKVSLDRNGALPDDAGAGPPPPTPSFSTAPSSSTAEDDGDGFAAPGAAGEEAKDGSGPRDEVEAAERGTLAGRPKAPPAPAPPPPAEPAAETGTAAKEDFKATPEARPGATPEKKPADKGAGERSRGDGGGKAKTKEEAAPEGLPRQALFFRADDLARGQRSVESVLFALKDFPHQREPWVRAAELDTSYGRIRRILEEEQDARLGDLASRAGAAAPLPGEKVLQIRIQGRDLDRLRAALDKDPILTETHVQVISGLLADASPDAPENLRRDAEEEGSVAGGGAGAGADGPSEDGAKSSGGGTPAPGEPVPPALPTKDQLKKLAEPPPREQPPAAGPAKSAGRGGPGGEMILEIHVFENPLAPPTPVAPAAPAGGAPK